jgi:uncharacterized protein YecT (DUF1311 family)
MTKLSLLLLLLFAVPCAARAQEQSTHPIDKAFEACTEKDPSTGGMVQCIDVAYKKWDQQLNRNYQALMAKLNPAGKAALKSAQLGWIGYRDKEFKLIDSIYDTLEGSMYVPMRYDQKMQVVRNRALALATYKDLE